MAVGQVSFHSDKKVKRGELGFGSFLRADPFWLAYVDEAEVHVVTRENAIVNRLNKTKLEKEVDHEAERQARLKDEGRRKKAEAIERVSRTNSFIAARYGQLIQPEGSGRG